MHPFRSLLRDVIDVEDGGCGFESLGRSGEYYCLKEGVLSTEDAGRGKDPSKYRELGLGIVRMAVQEALASEGISIVLRARFNEAKQKLEQYEDGPSKLQVCTKSIGDADDEGSRSAGESKGDAVTAGEPSDVESKPELPQNDTPCVPYVEEFDGNPNNPSVFRIRKLGPADKDGLKKELRSKQSVIFLKTGKARVTPHHLRPCLPFSVHPDASGPEDELNVIRKGLLFKARGKSQPWRCKLQSERTTQAFYELHRSLKSDSRRNARKLTVLAALLFLPFNRTSNELHFLRDTVSCEERFPAADFGAGYPESVRYWLCQQLEYLRKCFPHSADCFAEGAYVCEDDESDDVIGQKVRIMKGFLCSKPYFSHGTEAQEEPIIGAVKDFNYMTYIPR
eukprot:scaffold3666_cov315-Pinguiococcus_pyrenoidosus.AAC.2